jgi:nucleoid-associated protein YgaU
MSERALPTGDRPVACPFVAFVDDRDERASSPDHRHRCYAETSPAPRALAHQEAYCLSSAFPVCPTFQDWARREAARVHAGGSPSVAGDPIPGVAEERPSAAAAAADEDEGFEPVYEDRPRRSNQRDWASPPPWLSRSEPDDELGALAEDEDPLGARAAGLGGLAAGAGSAAAGAGGLSGSFADRLVSPAPDQPRQRTPVWRTGDKWDDEIDEGAHDAEAEPDSRSGIAAPPPEVAQRPYRQRERVQGAFSERGERRPAGDRERADRGDPEADRRVVAPSWERPARLETYPSLRSRRIPKIAVPSLILGAIAVVFAAILLFFLPGLLGLGGQQAGASPTPTATTPGTSLAPSTSDVTFAPTATQTTYQVQAGDTMSKIARQFGVPLAALIDANKATIPNPNVLKVGDVLIIPATTPTALPGASPSP